MKRTYRAVGSLLLLPLASLLALAAGPAPAAPPMTRRSLLLPAPAGAPPREPVPPGGARKKTVVEVKTTQSQVVDWSYVRMHYPDLVVGMLEDVQAGRLPASAVAGLASPRLLSQLLQVKWAAIPA